MWESILLFTFLCTRHWLSQFVPLSSDFFLCVLCCPIELQRSPVTPARPSINFRNKSTNTHIAVTSYTYQGFVLAVFWQSVCLDPTEMKKKWNFFQYKFLSLNPRFTRNRRHFGLSRKQPTQTPPYTFWPDTRRHFAIWLPFSFTKEKIFLDFESNAT